MSQSILSIQSRPIGQMNEMINNDMQKNHALI
jgi:hypothetical protein